MEKQTVWFNVSDLGHSGILVTDVIEVIGSVDDCSPSFIERTYLPTPNGGYIMRARTQHFFTEEEADRFMKSYESSWMVVERY